MKKPARNQQENRQEPFMGRPRRSSLAVCPNKAVRICLVYSTSERNQLKVFVGAQILCRSIVRVV